MKWGRRTALAMPLLILNYPEKDIYQELDSLVVRTRVRHPNITRQSLMMTAF